jgi:thiamine biosynthesis protein ThiS
MTIRLNGDSYPVPGPLSVTELLARLDVDARRVAVELNLAVVRKAAYDSSVINDGDEVEIVNFVGGG